MYKLLEACRTFHDNLVDAGIVYLPELVFHPKDKETVEALLAEIFKDRILAGFPISYGASTERWGVTRLQLEKLK